MGMIRLQSAKLTEISLAAKSKEEMQCFKKTVCVVGATMDKKERRIKAVSGVTLARGVHQFTKILELMISDIEQSSYHMAQDFPHIYQVLGRWVKEYLFRKKRLFEVICSSYAVGSTTKDVAMCDRLFTCQAGVGDLTLPAHERQGRATCAAVGAVCPGLSIGCAVCAVFAPSTCGDQCIVAGLYCGTSLLGCAQEAKKEDEKNETKN